VCTPLGFRDLYHGTVATRVGSIRPTGLNPGWWAMLTAARRTRLEMLDANGRVTRR
jgi:hypothetical protein